MRTVALAFAFVWSAVMTSEGVMISEIMYHPTAENEASYEWIELYNDYAVPLDIGGWSFSRGITFQFPRGVIMQGKSYLVVCADKAAMEAMYGIPSGKLMGPFQGRLDNGGEEVALADRMGAVMAHVDYKDRDPWPAAADGAGHSLALINTDLENDESESWALSPQRLGSPGEPNGFDANPNSPPIMNVGINEFLANWEETFVELVNNNDVTVDIGLAYLSEDPADLTKYQIPKGTSIGRWGCIAFTGTEMGFQLPDKDGAIYFTTPDGQRVIDAQAYGTERLGMSRARYPDGEGRWYATPTPTSGQPNQISVNDSIVINELMYHPYENNDDLEYIELYNRGNVQVDMSGWSFSKGVDFVFPLGTSLGPDEYLVVARDQRAIYKKYYITNIIGDFTGNLDNEGESLELVDTFGNAVDQVRYAGGGRWPIWAAGWGSSLELIDPRQENNAPSAWAPSDDRSKAVWTHVQYDGEFAGGESEFHFFLLHRGECLIDDLSMTRSGREFIPNGSFEWGTSDWLIEGNHIQTMSYTEEAHSGSQCLKIVSTGRGDTGANRIECDTSGSLSAGQSYTISFWAKWQRGMNLVYTRTHNQGAAKASRIPMPGRRGTPGNKNSVYASNIGPVVTEVKHEPIVPSRHDGVKVTARVRDCDGVSSVTLYYKGDYEWSFESVQMYDDGQHGDGRPGDGLYVGTIPPRGSGELMEFYMVAKDGRSVSQRFPAKEDVWCLYQVEDWRPTSKLPIYRILLSHEADERLRSCNRMSNELEDCTFVLNESKAYYNCGIRTRGSGWTRQNHPSDQYRIRFYADQRLQGVSEEINLDWHADETRQKDRAVQHLLRELGRVPTSYLRYVHVRFNGGFAALADEVQIVDADYVRLYWPDDSDGNLFKIDDHFEYDDWMGHTHTDAFLLWQGSDTGWTETSEKEKYRWNWELHTNEKEDSYSDFLKFVLFMDPSMTSNADFDYQAENVLDVDEWLRVLCVRFLVDDWDTFGYNRGKNASMYKPYHEGNGTSEDPPRKGEWVLIPWDSDLTFGNSSAPIVSDMFPCVKRMLERPRFQRWYYSYFLKLIDGPFSRAQIDPVLDGIYAVLANEEGAPNGPGGMKGFISSRITVIRSRIPRVSFVITTNSGNDWVVEEESLILEGTAPVHIRTMEVRTSEGQGVPLVPTWKTTTQWETRLLLTERENRLVFTGKDMDGNDVGTCSITIRVRLSATKDSDNDGLNDREEEEVYHTQYQNSDTDGDGMKDGDEVLAGTDPLDETSLFIVAEIVQNADGLELMWSSVPGRDYAVQESKDLVNWRILATIRANSHTSSYSDGDASGIAARFYRVGVLPQP